MEALETNFVTVCDPFHNAHMEFCQNHLEIVNAQWSNFDGKDLKTVLLQLSRMIEASEKNFVTVYVPFHILNWF